MFFAIGGTTNPVEIVLYYHDLDTGAVGMARTFRNPEKSLFGYAESPLLDSAADAGKLVTPDEIASLRLQVSKQLVGQLG